MIDPSKFVIPAGADLLSLVRARFDHDAERGLLIFRPQPSENKTWNTRHAGKVAGSTNGKAYWRVNLFGCRVQMHRLIWFYVYGEWPEFIDHINGDSRDNRLANLRSVSAKENCRNQSIGVNNTSGVLGVGWAQHAMAWRAHIKVDGKFIHLGYFKSKEEAVEARAAAQADYGFHENHGARAASYGVRQRVV